MMYVSSFRHLDVPLINGDEILTQVREGHSVGESGEGGEGEGGRTKAAMTAKKVQPPDLKKCAQQRELSCSVSMTCTLVCARVCLADGCLHTGSRELGATRADGELELTAPRPHPPTARARPCA